MDGYECTSNKRCNNCFTDSPLKQAPCYEDGSSTQYYCTCKMDCEPRGIALFYVMLVFTIAIFAYGAFILYKMYSLG